MSQSAMCDVSVHQQTLDPLLESTAVLHRACSDF